MNVCETLVRQRGEDGPGRKPPSPRPGPLPTTAPGPSPCARASASTTARPSTPTRWCANFESLRRARGFPGTAERLGPLVVRLLLDRPNAALLSTLSQPYFAMQSPRALSSEDTRAVGTGPFRLVTVHPGLIELAAEPRATGAGAPRLRRVLLRRFAREDALVAALLAGEVDVTAALGPARVDALREARRDLPRLLHRPERGLPEREQRAALPGTTPASGRPSPGPSTGDALVTRFLGGHGEPAARSAAAFPPRPPGSHPRSRPRSPGGRAPARGGRPVEGRSTRTLLTVDRRAPTCRRPVALGQGLRDQLAAAGIRLHADRGRRPGPTTWRASPEATTTSRCWAGRRTPPTPTIS